MKILTLFSTTSIFFNSTCVIWNVVCNIFDFCLKNSLSIAHYFITMLHRMILFIHPFTKMEHYAIPQIASNLSIFIVHTTCFLPCNSEICSMASSHTSLHRNIVNHCCIEKKLASSFTHCPLTLSSIRIDFKLSSEIHPVH